MSRNNLHQTNETTVPEVQSATGEETGPHLQRRARRFSLAISRSGSQFNAFPHASSIAHPGTGDNRERGGTKWQSEVANGNTSVGLAHTAPAHEERYFRSLTGSKALIDGQNTARDSAAPSLRSQEPLASMMTHRYAVPLSQVRDYPFSSSSPLMSSGSPQSRRARKSLLRSLSSPYFHSWTYGNVDLSHQIFINPHLTAKQVIRARVQAKTKALFARTPTFTGQSPNAAHLLQLTKPSKSQSTALSELWRRKFKSRAPTSCIFPLANRAVPCQQSLMAQQSSFSALSLLEYRKEISQERTDKGKTISSGSRRALVLALFDEQFYSTDHPEVFVYTHLAWLSASTLLHYFLGIWKDGLSSIFPATTESQKSAVSSPEAMLAVRNRIMEVIHLWIECCPGDFKTHHAGALNRTNHVHHELQQFLFTIMESGTSLECSMAELVLGTLNLAVRPNQPAGSRTASLSAPSSSAQSSGTKRNRLLQLSPSEIGLLDVSPREWAIQLTLWEFNAAKLLSPEHLATTQPGPLLKLQPEPMSRKSHDAMFEPQTPGTAGRNAIADATSRTQRFVGWVSTEIVTCPCLSARVALLGNLIEIAHRCYELRNYQSAYSIFTGISKPYVTRLSETWRALSAEHMYWWSKLSTRFSSLIDLFDECIEASCPKIMPLIPTLQLLAQQQVLKDVVKRGNWINFSKFRGISQIVKPVILAQQIAYPFADQLIPSVQLFLEEHLLCLPNNVLLRLSQDIEQGFGPSLALGDSGSESEDNLDVLSNGDDALERQNSDEGFSIRPLGQISRSSFKSSLPAVKMRPFHHNANQDASNSVPSKPAFVLKSPPASPPRTRPSQTAASSDSVERQRSQSTEELQQHHQVEPARHSSALSRKHPLVSTTVVNTPNIPRRSSDMDDGIDRVGIKSHIHQKSDSAGISVHLSSPDHSHHRHHSGSGADTFVHHSHQPMQSTGSSSSVSSNHSLPSISNVVSSPVPTVTTTTYIGSDRVGSDRSGSEKSSSKHVASGGEGDAPRDKTLKDLQSEVKSKWTRPWSQCSVGADLPRFIRKMVVIQESTNEIMFHGGGERDDSAGTASVRINEVPLPELIGTLLKTFATVLEAKKELKAIEKSLDLYFAPRVGSSGGSSGGSSSAPASFDLAKEADRFCREILGENAKVVSLLKVAASQGIVAPAWMKLRLFILSRFGFKDVKKGWNIAIIIGDSRVVVVHRKREASNEETTGHPDFEFTWEMRIIFSKKMDKLESASFAITNIAVSPSMPEKKLSLLKSTIFDWFLPGSDMFPKDIFAGPQLIPNAIILGHSPRDAPTSKKDKKRKSFGAVAREWFAGRHPFKGSDSSSSASAASSASGGTASPGGSNANFGNGSSSNAGAIQSTDGSLTSPPNSSRSKLSKSSKGKVESLHSPSSTVQLSFNATTMVIPPSSHSSTMAYADDSHSSRRAKLVRRLSDSSSETFSISRKSSFSAGASTPLSVKKTRHRSGEIEEKQISNTTTVMTSGTSHATFATPGASATSGATYDSPSQSRRSRRGSEASSTAPIVSVYFPATATVSFGSVDYGGASPEQTKSTKKARSRSSEGRRVKHRSKSVESQENPSSEVTSGGTPSVMSGGSVSGGGGGGTSTTSSGYASTVSGHSSNFAQLYRQVSGEMPRSESSFGSGRPSSSGHRSPLRSSSDSLDSQKDELTALHRGTKGSKSVPNFQDTGEDGRSATSSTSVDDLEWSTDSSWSSIGTDGPSSPMISNATSMTPSSNHRRSSGRRRALSTESEGREAAAIISARHAIRIQSSSTGSFTTPHISRSPSSPPPVASPLASAIHQPDSFEDSSQSQDPSTLPPASSIPFNLQTASMATSHHPNPHLHSTSSPSFSSSNTTIQTPQSKRRLDHASSSSSNIMASSYSNLPSGSPSSDHIVRTGSKEGLPRKKSLTHRDSPSPARIERKDKEKRKSKTVDEDIH